MADFNDPKRSGPNRWTGMGPAPWNWIIGAIIVVVVLLFAVAYWRGGWKVAESPGAMSPSGTIGQGTTTPPAQGETPRY